MGVDHGRIEAAVWKRAEQIRKESDFMTLKKLRRLVEEDLGLEAGGLDEDKNFVRELVDQDSDQSEKYDEDEEEDEPRRQKQKKKAPARGSREKKPKKEKTSKGKRQKRKKEEDDELEEAGDDSAGSGEGEEGGDEEEEEDSPRPTSSRKQQKGGRSSGREAAAASRSRKAVSAAVEKLRSIIQAAGMRVPPNIYKKVKQADEDERDEMLERELEAFLAKEGLSRHSGEKEIKAVKRRKDRERDLEGIDMENIIDMPRASRTRGGDAWGAAAGRGAGFQGKKSHGEGEDGEDGSENDAEGEDEDEDEEEEVEDEDDDEDEFAVSEDEDD